MSNQKLSLENKEKLLGAINELYEFVLRYDSNPMVAMHLQQACLHLQRQIPQQVFIPVTICLTPEEFDFFIHSAMVNKPVPINNFNLKTKDD